MIKDLLALMRFRNQHPAFSLEGQIEVALTGEHGLRITRKQGEHFAVLDADLKRHTFEIRCS